MALATIPATTTDGSTDAYLLEVYRQAAETARPANRRFTNLGAFLGFLAVSTGALAVLFTVPGGSAACLALGILGLVVSSGSYALEIRREHRFGGTDRLEGSPYATSSIYQASIGFFAFAVAIAAALLVLD